MLSIACSRLRRAFEARGLAVATGVADGSAGRADEATIRPARLVDDMALRTYAAGPAEPLVAPVAFLDGTQRSEIIGYVGTSPVLVAEIGAAVRERRERELRTVVREQSLVVIGRAAALDEIEDAIDGLERLVLDREGPPHPVRDLVEARQRLDHRRGNLELHVGDRYRRSSDAWLIIDGTLGVSPGLAADVRCIGVSKSHATLPFDGSDLAAYLRLPAGHRSSIFEPAQGIAPTRAWGLRLWPWVGRDLFHGLVRVEVAPANGTPETADRISRWLLAERAPLADDARADRLLYGIHSVEAHLRAVSAFA